MFHVIFALTTLELVAFSSKTSFEIHPKICKLATRSVPTGNGICTYEDVISPWIFTSFNEELRDYLGYDNN